MKKTSSFIPITIFSILLAMISWISIGLVVIYFKPTLGPRWLFFFLFFIAVATSVLPVLILINRRISQSDEGLVTAAVRQSLMLGFFFDLIIWLQIGRVLDFITAFFILSIFIAIEILIQVFEGSQWRSVNVEEKKGEIQNTPVDD